MRPRRFVTLALKRAAQKFPYLLTYLLRTVMIRNETFTAKTNMCPVKTECRCMCRCRNIFSIQQCLTNITSNRESDLDHARQYYELLYLSPDVSINFNLFHCIYAAAADISVSHCKCFAFMESLSSKHFYLFI